MQCEKDFNLSDREKRKCNKYELLNEYTPFYFIA